MIITLLSDFGLHDYSPAIAKSILLKELPQASLVDLSHDIAPHHLLQCAYFLKSAYPFFPGHTIHISLVDLFRHRPFRMLMKTVDNNHFIAADNGLLPLAFSGAPSTTYLLAEDCADFPDWMHKAARFIAQWYSNGYPTEHLQPITPSEQPIPFEPYQAGDDIFCQVIHIDRFGNAVLNLNQSFFEQHRKGRKFQIFFSRNHIIDRLSRHYTDVPEGEALCRFNLGGYMEIAVNNGSTAQLFGFSLVRAEQLIYQKIKISFLQPD